MVSMLFRLLSGAKTYKTLKLELREEISVEAVVKQDEFEHGYRCG